MWENKKVFIGNKEYVFEAKVYDFPSMFGIENGRVSKLCVYDERGKIIYSYDRGGELPSKIIKKVLEIWPHLY